MLEEILSKENMTRAYKRVIENKGAGGIDGMKVEELTSHMQKNWESIKAELIAGRYIPSAIREVEIPKPNGGVRKLASRQ